MRSKAIRCLKTGKFRCPVPGCSIAGCSRVGVAKHFRRHHRNYRSWRDVFLNKDAPHFVLKNELDDPTIMTVENDKKESNGDKNDLIWKEKVSIQSKLDQSVDQSKSGSLSGIEPVASHNKGHVEKRELKIAPSSTEDSWSINNQMPFYSTTTTSHITLLSNSQILHPPTNVNYCPVILNPSLENDESNPQGLRNIVLANGNEATNQQIQPELKTFNSTENHAPVLSINTVQPNAANNTQLLVVNPVQIYPQNTFLSNSLHLYPQNLPSNAPNNISIVASEQTMPLESNTQAYPQNNQILPNPGSNAYPQIFGHAPFFQPPILLAMPVIAANSNICLTGSPLNPPFAKNQMHVLNPGELAYTPTALKQNYSNTAVGSNVDKFIGEHPPQDTLISFSKQSILPLQLIQTVPAYQPTQ